MAFKAIAGIFIVAVVFGVGFGVASADLSDEVAQSGALGFDRATQAATSTAQKIAPAAQASNSPREQSTLAAASLRTLDAGFQMIDEREAAKKMRDERNRKAYRKQIEAEDKAIFARVDAQKAKQNHTAYDLPDVDWSIGREAFIDEWSQRIDAFLADSPLEGNGYYFAKAAWENGVDPRWSPAISSTESGKGTTCFLPHNAWGWGESSWDDWESAIAAHVAGLAEVYGYSLTYSAAQVYCPPNFDFWYMNTLEKMASI